MMICAYCNWNEIKADPVNRWDQGHNGQPLVAGRVCNECSTLVLLERLKRSKNDNDRFLIKQPEDL